MTRVAAVAHDSADFTDPLDGFYRMSDLGLEYATSHYARPAPRPDWPPDKGAARAMPPCAFKPHEVYGRLHHRNRHAACRVSLSLSLSLSLKAPPASLSLRPSSEARKREGLRPPPTPEACSLLRELLYCRSPTRTLSCETSGTTPKIWNSPPTRPPRAWTLRKSCTGDKDRETRLALERHHASTSSGATASAAAALTCPSDPIGSRSVPARAAKRTSSAAALEAATGAPDRPVSI